MISGKEWEMTETRAAYKVGTEFASTLTERQYVEWAKKQPEHSRAIRCASGHEIDRAIRIRNHFVLVLGDVQVYRALLRCPECNLKTWWHAEHVLVAKLED